MGRCIGYIETVSPMTRHAATSAFCRDTQRTAVIALKVIPKAAAVDFKFASNGRGHRFVKQTQGVKIVVRQLCCARMASLSPHPALGANQQCFDEFAGLMDRVSSVTLCNVARRERALRRLGMIQQMVTCGSNTGASCHREIIN
jgi:hypothetical protein